METSTNLQPKIEIPPLDIEAEQLRLARIAERINSVRPIAEMLRRQYEG